VRQARYRECDSGAIRPDGVHAPAGLVRGDQVAA
jgi:hypothetical protein